MVPLSLGLVGFLRPDPCLLEGTLDPLPGERKTERKTTKLETKQSGERGGYSFS